MVRSINDVNMFFKKKSVLNSDYGLYIFIQPSVLDGEVQNHNSLIDGICGSELSSDCASGIGSVVLRVHHL